MLSCYLSLRYRTEAKLMGKEDDEFRLGYVDFEMSKKNLYVYVYVCWFSR